MGGNWPGASSQRWEIVEEHAFSQACSEIESDARRMDEMLDGIKDIVCRTPRNGELISESGGKAVWSLGTDVFPDAPRIVIYYTIDDDGGRVHLRHVVRGDEPSASAP